MVRQNALRERCNSRCFGGSLVQKTVSPKQCLSTLRTRQRSTNNAWRACNFSTNSTIKNRSISICDDRSLFGKKCSNGKQVRHCLQMCCWVCTRKRERFTQALCGLTKGEAFTCLLPAFSALQMFLRASFITDIRTILACGFL